MKILGNISHIANSGKLIVKSKQTPPVGAYVITSNKTKLGRVSDVFGPVKTPYISVKLFKSVNTKDLENNLGEELYLKSKNKRGNKKRKKKQKRLQKNQKN